MAAVPADTSIDCEAFEVLLVTPPAKKFFARVGELLDGINLVDDSVEEEAEEDAAEAETETNS